MSGEHAMEVLFGVGLALEQAKQNQPLVVSGLHLVQAPHHIFIREADLHRTALALANHVNGHSLRRLSGVALGLVLIPDRIEVVGPNGALGGRDNPFHHLGARYPVTTHIAMHRLNADADRPSKS